MVYPHALRRCACCHVAVVPCWFVAAPHRGFRYLDCSAAHSDPLFCVVVTSKCSPGLARLLRPARLPWEHVPKIKIPLPARLERGEGQRERGLLLVDAIARLHFPATVIG